jgi:hypothetical protein
MSATWPASAMSKRSAIPARRQSLASCGRGSRALVNLARRLLDANKDSYGFVAITATISVAISRVYRQQGQARPASWPRLPG